ncbi:hypothetical protein [Streptomyces sp. NPDC006610]|uniref:hypothetical protein n=1 Tax=Streptomyces sp. NPDC006610 TaxID=3154584 RepID=UPI0033B58396
MPCRKVLRRVSWGATLLAVVLLTGCSSSEDSASTGFPTSSRASRSSAPSVPESPKASPEPSPVISYLGKTKIVTLGGTEIRATPNEIGINVACNVTNTTDKTRNIRVSVSVGNGEDWVTTNNFDFRQVPAGQTASETIIMGASFEGDLPDDPHVYIDSVLHY